MVIVLCVRVSNMERHNLNLSKDRGEVGIILEAPPVLRYVNK